MLGLVGTVAKGAVAGAAGTLAMDLLWYGRYRRRGGQETFTEWAQTDAEGAAAAGTGAQVVQRAATAVGTEVPAEHADTVQDVAHWLSGVGNGVTHALVNRGRNPVVGGLVTGVSSFLQSRAARGVVEGDAGAALEDDPLGKDLGGHIVYGVATGLAHAVLGRR